MCHAHLSADISTMRMLPELRARDPRAAARSAVLTLALFAGVVAGLTKYQQASVSTAAYVAGWVLVVVLAVAAAVHLLVDPLRLDRWFAGTVISVSGVLAATVLNLLTVDTTAAAQAFLAFPVLWAAAHLRQGAVTLVTGTAVWADCVVLFLLQPPAEAAQDLLFFGAVLVVPAVMLTRANGLQERLVAELQEQARVDALTGLVNRRSFDEALESTLIRPVGAGTALVLIDVDSFKTINDSHGHPVGDAVLVHLARVLREQIRDGRRSAVPPGRRRARRPAPGLHARGGRTTGRGPAPRRPLDPAPPGRRHAAVAVDQPRSRARAREEGRSDLALPRGGRRAVRGEAGRPRPCGGLVGLRGVLGTAAPVR